LLSANINPVLPLAVTVSIPSVAVPPEVGVAVPLITIVLPAQGSGFSDTELLLLQPSSNKVDVNAYVRKFVKIRFMWIVFQQFGISKKKVAQLTIHLFF
jgi:hypothetical protein